MQPAAYRGTQLIDDPAFSLHHDIVRRISIIEGFGLVDEIEQGLNQALASGFGVSPGKGCQDIRKIAGQHISSHELICPSRNPANASLVGR